ncbi:MAG TPA: polysaccharide biosynthesis C-terminal domain-containing protein [Draconibacterium sp.]|nr:polysaccharide biosynthesis C-terminal domain-containing protein [Draconibacterium sp.]
MLSKKYINNISGLQVFQLLRFGTLLLISIVFTKSSVTTSSIGDYEAFLFVTALVCSFWINGLIQSFLPLFKSNTTFQKGQEKSPEIYNVFLLISGLSVLVIVVLLLFKNLLSGILTDNGTIPFFHFLLLYIFFSSPSYLIEYIYLLKNKAGWILKYGFITFGIQFILISAPAFWGVGMQMSIVGLVSISVIRYIWLLFLLKKYARFTSSATFIKEHLHLAYPLIISSLLGGSAQFVDGFLVLNKFDTATFAIFRYGAKEFPLVLLMANALSTAMISEFSIKEKIGEALKLLRQKSAQLMHLLFPVTILFIIFSHWLYPRIFNENFTESAVIFNLYLLLIISRLVFPHTVLIGLKKTRIVMYASLAELVVNVILSVTFIHFWGIEGVAFATFIAFATQKTIWVIYNKKVLHISPKQYIPITMLVVYSFLTLTAFYFMY